MGLTLKAGQLLVRFTESTCNAEKYQSRQNKRQRRKRHHTDDEAPSLGNKIEFTGPPKARKTLPSRPLSQAQDSANMVSKASARTAPMRARVKGTEIPVHPACRMGHMRLPCLTRDWSPRTRRAYSSKTPVRAKHYSSVISHSSGNYGGLWNAEPDAQRFMVRTAPRSANERRPPSMPIADMRIQRVRTSAHNPRPPHCSNHLQPWI